MKQKFTLMILAFFAVSTFATTKVLRRAATTLIDYPTSQGGITLYSSEGSIPDTQISFATVKIKGTATDCIKFGKSYSNGDNKYYAELSIDGGFKTGDVITITGVYNNSAEKNAAIAFYDANNTIWTTEKFVNTYDGVTEPTEQTFTLTADADKLFIGRSGNTGTCITKLTITREGSGDDSGEDDGVKNIEISPESGTDIAAALAEAVEGINEIGNIIQVSQVNK